MKNEDCLKGMRDIPSETIDICVTSPPYNLGIAYDIHDDALNPIEYLSWLKEVFTEVKRILKPQGHLWINVGYSNKNPWVGMDVAQTVRSLMVLQNQFIWVKSIAIDGIQTGHYKPINSQRYANPTWEHLFHFTKTGDVVCDREAVGVPYTDKSNLFRRHHQTDLHCSGNVWFIPYSTIASKKEKGNHPAIFPIELVERCIKFSGIKQGVLLDPFMGSGTSAIASLRQQLDFIGFELSKDYFSFANQRINEEITIVF